MKDPKTAICIDCGYDVHGEGTSVDGGETWMHYECEDGNPHVESCEYCGEQRMSVG